MAYIPKGARWYLADVVLEHTVDGDTRNVVHINTHLVEAGSPEEAYEKALALGRESEWTFENSTGHEVRVAFRGLRDLTVISEELEDGAEFAYSERVGVAEAELRAWLNPKEKLGVFADRQVGLTGPNYMPAGVMRALQEEGFSRAEIEGRRDRGA